jgi:hypothetical protein
MTSKDRATQPKLKLVVLGATGATGQLIVSQEPEQGHHVTAPARHSEGVAASHPPLRQVLLPSPVIYGAKPTSSRMRRWLRSNVSRVLPTELSAGPR